MTFSRFELLLDLVAMFKFSQELSWQNSIDSINRKREHLVSLGIVKAEEISGYGIIENHSGDVPQIGISADHRRQGLGSRLMQCLLDKFDAEKIRFNNPDSAYVPLRKFCESINVYPGAG